MGSQTRAQRLDGHIQAFLLSFGFLLQIGKLGTKVPDSILKSCYFLLGDRDQPKIGQGT